MQVISSAFLDNSQIPLKYTCNGEGISPPLTILDLPPDPGSLALIVDDPDAPNGIFTHWIIWNIPNSTTISAGNIPAGSIQGNNSSGQIGYIPPCPAPGGGVHHYRFIVYALKSELSLPEGSNRVQFDQEVTDLIIGQAELIGLFSR